MNDPMNGGIPHGRPTDAQLLAGRLAVGWSMIEQETRPERREQLERHWLDLLREYERIVDASMPDIERGAAA